MGEIMKMHFNRMSYWMAKEKVMSFRVFAAHTDDKDYTRLDSFNLDAAVFFNGKTFYVFCDVIAKGMNHRGYKTVVKDRAKLGEWLAELSDDIILMGYNTTKLDYQLLVKAYGINFKTIDLMDAIGLSIAEELALEKKRYPLRTMARWNSIKQTVLPHFSWFFNSVEMFNEWFNNRFRSVAKNLCAECEMTAKLGARVRRKGEVRVLDPVTEKGVLIPIDFHQHVLAKGFFTGNEEQEFWDEYSQGLVKTEEE
tara:strand:+ start:15078 stop:15836 length:759 start_codon:yes stop_codon:yes gene_type:complete